MATPSRSADRQADVPRYLYIVSLERSGSTPLTYNLGLRPGFAALGEVDRTLELMARPGGFSGRDCSCGSTIPACPVWADDLVMPYQCSRGLAWLGVCLRLRVGGSLLVETCHTRQRFRLQGLAAFIEEIQHVQ